MSCDPTFQACEECAVTTIELHQGVPGLPGAASSDAAFLQGVPIEDVAPTIHQSLVYNGTVWTPTTTTAGTY